MSANTLHFASVFASTADGSRTVAFERSPAGEERVTSLATWQASVSELGVRLAGANVGRGSRVALFDEDPLSFSIALFALWARGAVAVLAPNAQPGTFERLGEIVEASVGVDIGLGAQKSFEVVLSSSATDALVAGDAPVTLERGAAALELFTSGTTGEGKSVGKRISHLEDEVRVLEQTFGAGLGSARVYATASHQHLYGLLFRVLWPLAAGRPFCRDRLLHAEELLPRLAAEPRSLLASVPAHLDRMRSASGFAQWLHIGAKDAAVCSVFSSGGPLGAATAHGWEQMLGNTPTEVFGSTETGGVAYRRQRRELGEDVAWRVFEGVRTSLDDAGCLRVASSIVSEGCAEGEVCMFTMGDRAELLGDTTSPGGFRLRGRADRVVKIGEKRVSLPEMESRLRTHAFVSSAALVAVSLAGQERVGAAVVTSEEGAEVLSREGRAALGHAL
ncbi:MAG: AMP-binding protein, partial [Polyangiaceae bacterium]